MNEKRFLSETSHKIYYATYDRTGEFIATTGSDNNIIVWNANSGLQKAVSDKLENYVLSVDAHPVKNDFISSC